MPTTHFNVAGSNRYTGEVQSIRDDTSAWVRFARDGQAAWFSCEDLLQLRISDAEATQAVRGLLSTAAPSTPSSAADVCTPLAAATDLPAAGSTPDRLLGMLLDFTTPTTVSNPSAGPSASPTAAASGGLRWSGVHKSLTKCIASSKPITPETEAERRVMVDALSEARSEAAVRSGARRP